ncbi:MAG: flagellar biosynthesis anti-sigma factor FlgM [Acetobacterium sp.]
MKISFQNNNKLVQPKQNQDVSNDPAKNIETDEAKKLSQKSKVDSSEISSSRNSSFDDKRLSGAKSTILLDVSVNKTERLQALKEAVNNGTYKVPTELLAAEMLK